VEYVLDLASVISQNSSLDIRTDQTFNAGTIVLMWDVHHVIHVDQDPYVSRIACHIKEYNISRLTVRRTHFNTALLEEFQCKFSSLA